MSTDLLSSGYAYLRRGNPEIALSYFQCAIDQSPDQPQAYFAAAMAYLEQGLKVPAIGRNEHVVAMARKLLTQSRQKSKGIICT